MNVGSGAVFQSTGALVFESLISLPSNGSPDILVNLPRNVIFPPHGMLSIRSSVNLVSVVAIILLYYV